MRSDASAEYLAERRGNWAMVWSMLASIALFSAVLFLDFPLALSGVALVAGGLLGSVLTNLAGGALLRHAVRGASWARGLGKIIWPLAPLSIAAYMAGIFLLLFACARWLWAQVVG